MQLELQMLEKLKPDSFVVLERRPVEVHPQEWITSRLGPARSASLLFPAALKPACSLLLATPPPPPPLVVQKCAFQSPSPWITKQRRVKLRWSFNSQHKFCFTYSNSSFNQLWTPLPVPHPHMLFCFCGLTTRATQAKMSSPHNPAQSSRLKSNTTSLLNHACFIWYPLFFGTCEHPHFTV